MSNRNLYDQWSFDSQKTMTNIDQLFMQNFTVQAGSDHKVVGWAPICNKIFAKNPLCSWSVDRPAMGALRQFLYTCNDEIIASGCPKLASENKKPKKQKVHFPSPTVQKKVA